MPIIKSSKLISLDIFKALAASFVFFFHHNIGYLLAERTGYSFLSIIDTIGSTYAVLVFFILSGFCIELSFRNTLKSKGKLDLFSFYKRRINRVYFPYLFALIFSICVNYLTIPNYTLGLKDLVSHLLVSQEFSTTYFFTVNVIFWTIAIELAFYLLYPLYSYSKILLGEIGALGFITVVSSLSTTLFSYFTHSSYYAKYSPTNLFIGWCFGCELFHLHQLHNKREQFINLIKISSITLLPLFIIYSLFAENKTTIIYNLIIIACGFVLLFFIRMEHHLIKKML